MKKILTLIFGVLLLAIPVKASPPSPVPTTDNNFVIVFDSNLDLGANSLGALNSFPVWANDTINSLIQSPKFQQVIEGYILDLINDPDTPEWDALFDEEVDIPLIGSVNIGLHIQDIWDVGNLNCGLPVTDCPKPAAKFADADTDAINIDWSTTSVNFTTNGPNNITVPLTNTTNFEGDVEIDVQLGQVIADVWLRQPDNPLNVTTGTYIHGIGRIVIPGLHLNFKMYSVGGDLRSLPMNIGYGIGLDFTGMRIEGKRKESE